MNSGLCEHCRRINVNSIVPYGANDPQIGPQQAGLVHQPTYDGLRTSSARCPLCALFYDALERANAGRPVPPGFPSHERSRIWLHAGAHAFTDLRTPKGLYHMVVSVGRGGVFRAAAVSITTRPDDPLALSGDVIGRPIDEAAGLVECAKQVTEWLSACESQHIRCSEPLVPPAKPQIQNQNQNQTQSSNSDSPGLGRHTPGDICQSLPLPTRLIDVGSMSETETEPPVLRLKETLGSYGRYCALSYSWGRSKSFRTHRSTYTDRIQGFQLDDLPITIREAVRFTRLLGYRYIWVDALCIIQDDARDWARESACMDQIYGLATLTIAASACRDKWDGLVHGRRRHQGVAVTSGCSNSSNVGTMFFSPRAGVIRDVIDGSPLANRAWTLQEQHLSRRTVHFTREQVYWECQQCYLAEDGLDSTKEGSDKNFLAAPATARSSSNPNPNPTWDWMLTRWQWVVENYAQRKLFAPSDKLPALAGLANQFRQRTGATYLAGLWREELPLGLLWTIQTAGSGSGSDSGSGRGLGVRDTGHSAAEYRAPSWSWASIDGAVHYAGYADMVTMSSADTALEQLQVLSADMSLKQAENACGEVTTAVLRVRGKVQRARRTLEKPATRWAGSVRLGYFLHGKGEIVFDNENVNEMVEGDPVFLPIEFPCLLVDRRKEPDGTYSSCFLALEEVHQACYKRIGVGYAEGPDWFASCDSITLSLV
ncbi:hypothetical protein A1O3_00572 [Capronia epimyces CBS 606.96]|uniref:Heterokaryon incompatibility domain-containing protein n=1 Tax=Capronia epimyces CBS 606.96 TaxID=1182542 RepID=W9YGK1_9EURO|nr:uncharacterized protein A1O3_00572 [Capronia epimyces CBS 606.96]EXJ92022.1 hypothetical protein A1O3_00572 [Capronia epimyces CBS 606.96]